MNNILVLGYFSSIKNESCGQSIKTRNIYNLLKENNDQFGNLKSFDTELFQKTKLYFLKMIWEILHCKKLVYVPAQNNLKYIFPFIYLICKIRDVDILYFVVGGWLAEFLQNKRFHVHLLTNIKIILAESDQLTSKLVEQYNLNNVTTFPNFRINTFIPSFISKQSSLKIVFMARISRMKGLDMIFMLADYIKNLDLKERTIIIDFYGLIESDEEYFFDNIKKYPFVDYIGILEPDQIYSVLSNYDLLVLPTKYYTEGFPGSILDAYISGIPVIVTKWKYADEFVENGETGYIIPFENGEAEFINSIMKLYNDNVILQKMKIKAHETSKLYSSESAWKIINQFITQ